MGLISIGRLHSRPTPTNREVGRRPRRRRRRAAGQLVGGPQLVGAPMDILDRFPQLVTTTPTQGNLELVAQYPTTVIDPYYPEGNRVGTYAPTDRPVYEDQSKQEVGESFLGDSIEVLAGATEEFILRPETDLFRVDKIVIPSNIAANFRINDIKFGTKTIFAGNGSIPAMMFSEDATSPLVGSYTLKTSQSFSMMVENVSNADLTFEVGLKGRHLK